MNAETLILCIDVNNDLYIFGYNGDNQLGLDGNNRYKAMKHPSLSDIIDISTGGKHSFVKTSNNEIYAFGYNEYSQIGIETITNCQKTPIRVLSGKEDIWNSSFSAGHRIKSARN